MLAKWPIRNKLLLGVLILFLMLGALSWSSFYGLYEYRGLVKSLDRVAELRHATDLARAVTELRLATGELARPRATEPWQHPLLRENEPLEVDLRVGRDTFRLRLRSVDEALARYRQQLENDPEEFDVESLGGDDFSLLEDRRREFETVGQIEKSLAQMRDIDRDELWLFDAVKIEQLREEAEHLQALSAQLPNHLHNAILTVSRQLQGRYRRVMLLGWISAALTVGMLLVLVRMVCQNVLRPVRLLAQGARRVAAGKFDYYIEIEGPGEMAELAAVMNQTTARFLALRDDLDRQVQERTAQIVRSERLASVGFLAAGVSHEINNPLHSIALSAESLEGRLRQRPLEEMPPPDREVFGKYLHMIRGEAARCREITARLLDFSRAGDVRREPTDLGSLVREMIDMLSHLAQYRGRTIELNAPQPVVASVNPQELKQVVLNLLTNALESLDEGGRVRIDVRENVGMAQIVVGDTGCGMTDEVQRRLFEPFFTRRRDGQGTGLGLTIADRIVRDHGGRIEAHSAGPGQGSTFRVAIPLRAAGVATRAAA
ncbi:MAG: HAMP domain-containing histidine kinase [Planctomycetia bacterium]|nr:HAMP domain-containing histidine kinase [Planctomycetia bacterium]